MRVHGLEARQGETAFAFVVFRLQRAAGRSELIDLIHHFAAIIPDADAFIADLPDDELDEPMRIVGVPWVPPEPGEAVEMQRRLIEESASKGVEETWFFQTGTSLPNTDEDDDEDAAGDEYADDSMRTQPIVLADPEDLQDDDDDDDADSPTGPHGVISDEPPLWSHGAPPMVSSVRFPVDGYPAILDELDWEDFGIAFKLAGPAVPGEGSVLFGLHALWLAPYGGRYRNAAVTIDRTNHAAHLWVDRFAVPSSTEQQVHHLLWVLSKLDEVIPVVHARFAGATMTQKYGGLMGETEEPFVLGGNPLVAVHAEGGDAAIDGWIAGQSDWSNGEVAQMLRELAIDLVTTSEALAAEGPDPGDVVDATFDDGDDDDDDSFATADREIDDPGTDEECDRHIARYAGELLAARATAGVLDTRVASILRPLLRIQEKYAHRRCAVVDVLGALRERGSVAALCRMIDDNSIKSYTESIGREDLLTRAATALGAIGDPAAIPALTKLITASGDHNDEARPAAADALATCLAAAPEPRDVDDAVLTALLSPLQRRNEGDANSRLHFAYGRLARVLAPARREVARRRLEDSKTARDDLTPMLARQVALVLARGGEVDPATADALRPLLHQTLTSLDYSHEHTLRNVHIALRMGFELPQLIDPADLVWLTRFSESEIREQAHALLARLGKPLALAPVFDRRTAKTLDATELVRLINEPHVVGRAALIAEAGRRSLPSARGAVLQAAHDVIGNARQGGANLLDPESRVLEAAVRALRSGSLDPDVIALFDRMLRHSNHHVKWEVMQDPPFDDRLIGGMFHVLAEQWGWQEKTAKQWLSRLQGSPAFEIERKRAGAPHLLASDDDDDDGLDDDDDDDDDDDVN
ncbi:MAG: HEAT repeat domain-containing protein [Deltaproteobacteria bacterium]|nr:HEAT repeat domain-containing protein [Deltaproteobacteria bacterium]